MKTHHAYTSTAFEVTGLRLIDSSSSPPRRVRGCLVFQFVDVEGLNNIRQLPVDQNSSKVADVCSCRKNELILFGEKVVVQFFLLWHRKILMLFFYSYFMFSPAHVVEVPEPHTSHFNEDMSFN